MKLRAEPYTLETRPLKDYDAVLWNEKEKAILFVEYKNTPSSYNDLKTREAQEKYDQVLKELKVLRDMIKQVNN